MSVLHCASLCGDYSSRLCRYTQSRFFFQEKRPAPGGGVGEQEEVCNILLAAVNNTCKTTKSASQWE